MLEGRSSRHRIARQPEQRHYSWVKKTPRIEKREKMETVDEIINHRQRLLNRYEALLQGLAPNNANTATAAVRLAELFDQDQVSKE